MKTFVLGVLPGLVVVPVAGHAQAPAQLFRLHIAAQPLNRALAELAAETGLQIARFSDADDAGKPAPSVVGQLTLAQALDLLLSGTSLEYRFVNDHTIAIVRAGSGRPLSPAASQAGPEREPGGQTEPTHSDKSVWQRMAGIFAACTLASAGHVCAQSVAPALDPATQLEEVVVTAQKRSERLQDVPVPVSVVDPVLLAEQGQSRMEDYFASVPGLNLAQLGSGQQSIAIRGVTTSYAANPTVGVTVDDVPFGSSTVLGFGALLVPDFDPSDLANIEVLRGPQGTLYGASSLGGLVKFETKDPSLDALSGRIQVLGEDLAHGAFGYGVRGAINVPLSDTVAIRASGFSRRDPGYIDNVTTGRDGVNRTDVYGGHLSMLWRPSESLSVTISALQQNTEGDGSAQVDADASLNPVLGALTQARAVAEPFSAVSKLYTATVKAAAAGLDFVFVSGYGINHYSNVADATGNYGSLAEAFYGAGGASFSNSFETDKFTQEFRVSSAAGQRIEWLAGVFYTHESTKADQPVEARELPGGTPAGLLIEYNFPTTLGEFAAFGDMTLHFTDRFDLQLGGRESKNKQVYNETDSGPLVPYLFNGASSPFVNETQHADANAFTYLVTPRLKISPDLMVYARLTSGFRVGGNNVNAVAGGIPPGYEPDKTNNYELGIKGAWFDHALSLDASVYYLQWKSIQINLFNPDTGFTYTINGGNAKSQGLELTLKARPAKGLTIAATATVNDAALTENLPAASTAIGSSGDRLPYSSRFSGNLSVDQEFPITAVWEGFVGGSVSYVGSRDGEFVSIYAPPAPRFRYPGYADIDVRAGVRYGTWTANVFLNNATDKRGVVGGGNNYYNGGYDVLFIQPLTAGLSVAKEF